MALSELGLVNFPTSRNEFAKYCLRRLGYPVIKINVSDEQVNDRINDALLFFFDYHFDGTEQTYFKYQITQQDIDNGYITLPEEIFGAVRMFDAGSASNQSSMFSYRYQFTLNDLYPLVSGSVLSYVMTMTHLAFLNQVFVGQQPIQFNRYSNKMYIDDWSMFSPGQWLVIEAYKVLDPSKYPELWRDRWITNYATALIKRQWGNNLKKYGNMLMPGGVTFNGQTTYDEAQEELQALENEMINSYSLPVSHFIG